jgi:hypothetical protein
MLSTTKYVADKKSCVGENKPVDNLFCHRAKNSQKLGYQIRPNDYFQTAEFCASPADLGGLGYWLLS